MLWSLAKNGGVFKDSDVIFSLPWHLALVKSWGTPAISSSCDQALPQTMHLGISFHSHIFRSQKTIPGKYAPLRFNKICLTLGLKNISFYIHCNNNLETSYPQIFIYKSLPLIQNLRVNWCYPFFKFNSLFPCWESNPDSWQAKQALTTCSPQMLTWKVNDSFPMLQICQVFFPRK